jgi:predicted Kef-type K+ transport protein
MLRALGGQLGGKKPYSMLAIAVIVLAKFIVGFAVLHRGFGQPAACSALAALGLSQISEFAFVIAGRAKSLKIISREVGKALHEALFFLRNGDGFLA